MQIFRAGVSLTYPAGGKMVFIGRQNFLNCTESFSQPAKFAQCSALNESPVRGARCLAKAAKYEIQKPSACCTTLFRCKCWSMFPIFHLA